MLSLTGGSAAAAVTADARLFIREEEETPGKPMRNTQSIIALNRSSRNLILTTKTLETLLMP